VIGRGITKGSVLQTLPSSILRSTFSLNLRGIVINGDRCYESLTHSLAVCCSSAAVTHSPMSIEFEVNT
jgi:hypothetical protein